MEVGAAAYMSEASSSPDLVPMHGEPGEKGVGEKVPRNNKAGAGCIRERGIREFSSVLPVMKC